jgi:hypothetical protein
MNQPVKTVVSKNAHATITMFESGEGGACCVAEVCRVRRSEDRR